ncbi:MAG TPA: hypothetical protein VFS26_02195 [Solirubrobacterales bacterium]|nr:hypothetical protein [Solirubrobacterales bacterium]
MAAAKARIGTPALLLLIWLLAASGLLLLLWGSKLTFLLDDWEFLLYRRDFDAIFEPHGPHISVIPVLIYKGLLATVGMDSAFPFRVVSVGAFLLSAVLLFVFLQRRVGQWPALASTAIVLFLGAAWEDLLWAFQIGYFGSMATGLGALLLLERENRRADFGVAALLTISILFSSLGLPFIAGVAVQVLLRPDRWRRLYVVVVPAAVFALWWLGWGREAESSASWENLAQTPLFVLDGIAASFASLFGLAQSGGGEPGGLEWGRPIAVVAIALGLWRAFRLGQPSAWLWIALSIGASFWILAGINQMEGRDPWSSRYQYVGVIFTLLVAAELIRGVRLSRGAVAVIFVVVAGAVAGNIDYLHGAYRSYRFTSQLEKADLGALDVARDTVDPGFVLEEDLADTAYVHVDAAAYFSAEDAFGTPAYDPAELAEAPDHARYAADKVLFGALRLAMIEVPASTLPGGSPPPAEIGPSGTVEVPAGSCLRVPSEGVATPLLALPRQGAVFQAGPRPIDDVRMARFAVGEFPIDFQQGVAPGKAAEISTPPDRSSMPWRIRLETGGPATVCGLPS